MIFRCDNCGEVKQCIFDGYCFGDRLLEGVMFIGFISGEVRVSEESEVYFQQLNQQMWLEQAKEYLSRLDIGQCIFCKKDLDIFHEGGTK